MKQNLILFNKAILVLTVCIAISSCHVNSTYDNREEDKNDAEKITTKFYGLLKSGNYKATYELFSSKFFAVTDTEKLNNIYNATNEKLGPIENINIDKWETQAVHGTDNKTDYAFLYIVRHKNFDSKETITLTKENGGIKIVGYNVNSDGFFTPEKK